MTMTHEEFLAICTGSCGAPSRGWQKNLVANVAAIGESFSQSHISQHFNNPAKPISTRTATIMREIANRVGSGDLSATPPKSAAGSSVVVSESGALSYQDPDDDLTDEEIMEDIRYRFGTFDESVREVMCGERRALMVSGPPGSGKSHTTNKYQDSVNGEYRPITGTISPPKLYEKLYECRDGGVVTLDDCDKVFEDVEALNLLKGALDVKPKGRPNMISWMKMTKGLNDEDGDALPKTFDFQGRVLFLTNIDFEAEVEKGTKRSHHLGALLSRSGYMTLGLHSRRRRMLRIEQIVIDGEGKIFLDNGVEDPDSQEEIMEYIRENIKNWRNISPRLIPQISTYYNNKSICWKRHTKALLMKGRR